MTLRARERNLHGIIPPLVTPLLATDQLDVKGLTRIVEHLLAGGVHGLFVLGTTGECPSLSRSVRQQITELTCELADDRVPVLVGVTETSLDEAFALADFAHASGATAVVAAPPYYYVASDEELVDYYERLADRSLLPVVLYNMPQNTKLTLSPNLLSQLVEHENVIALKDSSGDLAYLQQALNAVSSRADFPVLVGPEQLLSAALALGAAGGVSGGAHLAPRWFVDLYHAHLSGDRAQRDLLQARIDQFGQTIYRVSARPSKFIAGIKSALRAMGLCDDLLAPPLLPLDAQQRKQVANFVENLELFALTPIADHRPY